MTSAACIVGVPAITSVLLVIGITVVANEAVAAYDAVKLLITPLPDTLIDPVTFKLLVENVVPIERLPVVGE